MPCVVKTISTCVTPNTTLPITVDYAKLHLRAISAVEDTLIDAWIRAATQYVEEQTGRPIMRATWEYWLDSFPVEAKIELPHPPLQRVLAVEYINTGGVLTSFGDGASPETVYWQAGYPGGTYARRGWVEPIYNALWPTARVESGAVRIRYEAGYADDTTEVPELIKAALLMLVGQFDQFRSNTHSSDGGSAQAVPMGVDTFLAAFKYSAYPSQVLHRL